MKSKIIILILGAMLFAACTAEPVEVTREVEVEKEVEVTRVVEVTREVEVVEEVEVIQEVTVEVVVTEQVEVEVTRIVEVAVTAVPTDTPEPTPTNTPAPASASSSAPQPTSVPEVSLAEQLLQSMLAVRSGLQNYGGMIDGALRSGIISCEDIVGTYDGIAGARVYDMVGTDPGLQNAHGAYRAAIDVFTQGADDMTENCREFLNGKPGGNIGFQQWSLARQEVNTAVDIIHPAIQSLGGE